MKDDEDNIQRIKEQKIERQLKRIEDDNEWKEK